jgi:hypothetical protein
MPRQLVSPRRRRAHFWRKVLRNVKNFHDECSIRQRWNEYSTDSGLKTLIVKQLENAFLDQGAGSIDATLCVVFPPIGNCHEACVTR